MKYGHVANTRGVVGHPVGVTSIKDLFYLAQGNTEVAIREIASAGYAGVELFDGNVLEYPGGISALKALLRELGIELIGVYSGANFLFPDILPEELWRIEKSAEAASALSAEHLILGGGAKRLGGTKSGDPELVGKGLEKAVSIAEKHGLTASFHPHLGTCVEAPDQVDKTMRCTRINLCPDTAHLAAGGSNVAETIRKYAERIKYVHLKDFIPEPFGFVPLGEGRLALPPIVQALKDINYDGWLTVEADGYSGDPKKAAQASMRQLTAMFS